MEKVPFCPAKTAKPINEVGVKGPECARFVSGNHAGLCSPLPRSPSRRSRGL